MTALVHVCYYCHEAVTDGSGRLVNVAADGEQCRVRAAHEACAVGAGSYGLNPNGSREYWDGLGLGARHVPDAYDPGPATVAIDQI